MGADLSFRLFGPLTVTGGGDEPLDLGTRKQRALVAMLALEPGRVVSLDRLIEELWAGEPPAGATRTLQAYIAHLRKVLEPDRPPRTPPGVLLTREPGYLLAIAPVQIDLARFVTWAEDGRQALARGDHRGALQTLDRALDLWRGDPLGEFAGQAFAQPVVARLEDVRAAALEDRFEARFALGEAAISGLEELVEAYPYRERAWGLLVRALYQAGRQADALGALRRVRSRLADDLGLQPGPELRELEQAVFDQAPELSAPAPPVPAPDPPAAVPGERLIGRTDQLHLSERRLSVVRRGEGGVLLVSGEAGIGKTRFAQAVADDAEARGFRVAWGRCVDGTAPAFWPWTQVLRELGADGGLLAGGEVPGRAADAALFDLYERVVAALGGGPLLVVLDDLHWADASSLRLLAYVAEAVARRPVLLVVTLRPEPGARPDEQRDTLATLSRLQGTERVELAPFDADDIAAYLRVKEVAGEPDLVRVLLERTGGNPFYLGEVLRLRGSGQEVPPGARDVISRRVARLPEETGDLLRVIAVIGREADIELLEGVTGRSAEEVMGTLEHAVVTGLLEEPADGPDYRFPHALVREALYAGLGRLSRARLHLRVGEALEPLAAGPVTLARHFALAAKVGGAGKAVQYATRAAHDAHAQLAFTEAVQFWEMALAALPPGDDAARSRLLTRLGRARYDAGAPEPAYRDVREAIELARSAGDRDALISAVSAFGGLSLWSWWPYGVVNEPLVGMIEDLLDGPLSDHDRAVLLGSLGVELYYGPRRAEGEQYAAEAVRLARKIGDPALRARTLNNYVLAAFVPGRNPERLTAAREVLGIPDLPVATELVARVMLMCYLMRDADLAAWDGELIECERLLAEAPRPALEALVRVAETTRATLDGRWSDAEALIEQYAGLRFAPTQWGEAFHRLVVLYTCRRGTGRGHELLDELVATSDQPHLAALRPLAVLAAAEADRVDLAHELMERWGTEVPDDWTADFLLPVWGLVAARLGTPDPQPLYDILLPCADQLIVAGMGTAAWGSTSLVLAGLARRLGDTDQARAHAQAAHETHLRLGLTYWTTQSEALLTSLGG